MSGSLAAIITIPIVVVIVLFGWVAAVIYAESHPHWKRPLPPPRTEVAGGVFRALAGGRQVMPIPEEPPAGVPGQRAAAGDEYYETAVRRACDGRACGRVSRRRRPGRRGPGHRVSARASASRPASATFHSFGDPLKPHKRIKPPARTLRRMKSQPWLTSGAFSPGCFAPTALLSCG